MYKWYYQAEGTSGYTDISASATNGDVNNQTIGLGDYVVEISDNRPINTCNGCPTVYDTITFNQAPTPFDTVFGQYCGATGTFQIDNAPGDYKWYDSQTGGTELTGAFVSGTGYALAKPITGTEEMIADSIYSVWVEDVTITTGTVGKSSSSGGTQNINQGQAGQRMIVYSDVTLASVDINIKSYNGNKTVTFTPLILESMQNNGKEVYDVNNVYKTGTPFTLTFDNTLQTYTIPVDLLLEGITRGKMYWLKLDLSTSDFEWKYDQSQSFPYVDDIDGNTIEVVGFAKDNPPPNNADDQYGPFFNWQLEKPTDYICGRIQVSESRKCPPCNKPSSVNITNTTPLRTCEGDNITLQAEYIDGGNTVQSGMSYVWYKQFAPPVSGDYSSISGTGTVSIPDELMSGITNANDDGTWVLRVEDGTAGSATCYTESTIDLNVYVNPSLTVTAPGDVCFPQTIDLTGTWSDGNSTNPIVTYHDGIPANVGNQVSDAANIDTSDDYYIAADNNGCGDTALVSVTIKAKPNAPTISSSPLEYCVGETPGGDIVSEGGITGGSGTLTWYNVATNGTSITEPNLSTTSSGTSNYWVSEIENLCESDRTPIVVTIHDLPSPTIGSDLTAMCEGSSRTFSVTNPGTTSSFVWTTDNGATDDGITTKDLSVTAGANDFDITVVETDGNNCSNNPAVSESITVDPLPTQASIAPDTMSICLADPPPYNLPGNTPTNGTGQWASITGTTGGMIDDNTNANTSISGLSGGDYLVAEWTISSGVCPETKDTIVVEATAIATPIVSLSTTTTFPICEGNPIKLNANPSNGGTSPQYQFFDLSGASIQNQSPSSQYTFTPDKDSTIIVELTSNSSCVVLGNNTARDTFLIDVDILPALSNIQETDFKTCIGDFQLTADAISLPSTGTWSVMPSTGAPSVDATGNVLNIAAPSSNKIYYTVSTGGACPDNIDSVTITRSGQLTTPLAGTDATICQTASAPQLTSTSVLSPGESESWVTYQTAGQAIDGTGQTSGLQVGANVFYYIIENTSGGCKDSTLVTITVDAQPSTPTVTNATETTCSSSISLDASDPTPYSGSWKIISEINPGASISPNVYNGTLSSLGDGSTVLRYIVTNGTCADSVDKSITKQGNVTAAEITINGGEYSNELINTGSIDLCASNTYTLTASSPSGSAGEIGAWDLVGMTPNATISGGFVEVQPMDLSSSTGAGGTSTLTWTITPTVAGCNPNSKTVTFDISTSPNTPNARGPYTFCSSDVVKQLNATSEQAHDTGVWVIPSGSGVVNLSSTIDDENSAITGNPGSTSIWWKVTSGSCPSDSASTTVTINQAKDPGVSINPINKDCENTPMTITALGNGDGMNYEWFLNDGVNPEHSVQGPSIQNTYTGAFTLGSSIRVEYSVDPAITCVVNNMVQDSEPIPLDAAPVVEILGGKVTYCESGTLLGRSSEAGEMYLKSSPGGQVVSGPINVTGGQLLTFSVSNYGNKAYYVEVNPTNCSAKQSNVDSLEILERPQVSTNGETIKGFIGENVTLNGEILGSYTDLRWQSDEPLGALKSPKSKVTSLLSDQGGVSTYQVLAYNKVEACADTAQLQVQIRKPISIPNVFTPQSSPGHNDTWVIDGLETYLSSSLTVFNRWGAVVYKSVGEYRPWDGTRKGTEMPIGTYYYLLELNKDEQITPMKGTITILK